jgi:hypothetical protein
VVRHRGRRHALAGGELADADARRVLDRDEQRHLLRRNADLPSLPAQLAPNSKEGGPQLVGDGDSIDLSLRHIVNWVNDS